MNSINPEFMADLIKDPLRNIAVLGFFANYPLEKAVRVGDTLLFLGRSDRLWAYIASQNAAELTELLQKFRINTKYLAAIEDWMVPIITQNSEVEWALSTLRYVLPEAREVKPPIRKTSALDGAAVDYIYNHSDYKAFTSPEYIKERIENGISAGIREGGRLAAWALTHDDNALGFLHVLPEFRRKGYGMDILQCLILQQRTENKPVFLNVEPANLSATNLVNKTGFVFDRKISWIKLK